MKFLDIFKKKPEAKEEKKEESKAVVPAPKPQVDNPCSYCGNGGANKKWAGQYWHKQCIRQAKKEAKGMI
ncbi:MAG: hypothetical protein JXA43_01005 [Candidatus Diapherotrites archaeon]|nr:hypothetical protein [Candidatus Diapherotrites archaeon]